MNHLKIPLSSSFSPCSIIWWIIPLFLLAVNRLRCPVRAQLWQRLSLVQSFHLEPITAHRPVPGGSRAPIRGRGADRGERRDKVELPFFLTLSSHSEPVPNWQQRDFPATDAALSRLSHPETGKGGWQTYFCFACAQKSSAFFIFVVTLGLLGGLWLSRDPVARL